MQTKQDKIVFKQQFEISVDAFRKLIRWLRHRNWTGWVASDGTKLILGERRFHPPIQSWVAAEDGVPTVKSKVAPPLIRDKALADPHQAQFWVEAVPSSDVSSSHRCAAVDVVQIKEGVRVEFTDGQDPRNEIGSEGSMKPLGRALRDLRESLCRLLEAPIVPLGFSESLDPLDLMSFRQQQTIIHVEAFNCTTEQVEHLWRRLGNLGRSSLPTPDGNWLKLGAGQPVRYGWKATHTLYPVEPLHQSDPQNRRARPRWHPDHRRPDKCACIDVSSAMNGVVVFFHDRLDPYVPGRGQVDPLGRDFEYLCTRFIDELASLHGYRTDILDIPPDSEPPKGRNRRAVWRKIYGVWNRMLQLHRIEYDDPRTDQSPPTYETLQFEADIELGEKVSIRTLRKIVNCGNAGLLDEARAVRYWKEKTEH